MSAFLRKSYKLYRIIFIRSFRKALFRGVAAAIEHAAILTFLNRNNCKLIVDIGANTGQFSLAAREFVPGSRVIAFEPLDKPAKKYDIVFSSDRLVTLHRCAIGKSNESKEMHVSKRDDSSSLLPITDMQNNLFPGTGKSHVEKVDVRTLSSFVSSADVAGYSMLKIDVQGFELDVLKGCDGLLQKFSAIYIECSFVELYKGQALAYEIITFMRKYNFNLGGVYNASYDVDGNAIQADFLFLPERT